MAPRWTDEVTERNAMASPRLNRIPAGGLIADKEIFCGAPGSHQSNILTMALATMKVELEGKVTLAMGAGRGIGQVRSSRTR